ncbi:hypothetical protein [Bacillus inaquosorum]
MNKQDKPAWRLLEQPLKTLKPSLVICCRKPPDGDVIHAMDFTEGEIEFI